MKNRIELWALVGFIVAVAWVAVSFVIPLSPHRTLVALARVTCPIVPISMVLHFGVTWFWVIASNVVSYALIGLIIEGLRVLLHRDHATAHSYS